MDLIFVVQDGALNVIMVSTNRIEAIQWYDVIKRKGGKPKITVWSHGLELSYDPFFDTKYERMNKNT